MNRARRAALAALAVLAGYGFAAAGPAAAQQVRFLRTEDPQPVPAGVAVVEPGVEVLSGVAYPLSGLTGTLVTAPFLAFRIGFGRAEFRISGGYDVLLIDARDSLAPFARDLEVDGDWTGDTHDPVVETKMLLWDESSTRPAVAARVRTKLPSATNEDGLGTDALDWYVDLLAGRRWGATRLVANFGMGVLSIPARGDRQNDVLTYGLSLAHRSGRLEMAAEVAGRADAKADTPPGTENRGEARFGAAWGSGAVKVDGAVVIGLEDPDADVGLTLGASWSIPWFEPATGPAAGRVSR